MGIIGWVGCLAVVGLFCDCDLLLCLTSLIGDLLRCLSMLMASTICRSKSFSLFLHNDLPCLPECSPSLMLLFAP